MMDNKKFFRVMAVVTFVIAIATVALIAGLFGDPPEKIIWAIFAAVYAWFGGMYVGYCSSHYFATKVINGLLPRLMPEGCSYYDYGLGDHGTFTFDGIKYSREVFRCLARLKPGELFRFVRHDNHTIVLETINPTTEAKHD